jgi:hypothetical protein
MGVKSLCGHGLVSETRADGGRGRFVHSSARAARNVVRVCFVGNGLFRFLHRGALVHHGIIVSQKMLDFALFSYG